jgi:hypothetical protein
VELITAKLRVSLELHLADLTEEEAIEMAITQSSMGGLTV